MTTPTLTTSTITTPTITTPKPTVEAVPELTMAPVPSTVEAALTPTTVSGAPEACAQTIATLQPKAAPIDTDPASGTGKETYSDQHPITRWWNQIIGSIYARYTDEEGMSTIEYALGCVAAAALGALLYTVVTSDTVEQALSGIFEKALDQ